MERNEITECNKLIAEFMGLEVHKHNPMSVNTGYGWHNALYDFSWDWLMPVLSKIREIYFSRAFDESDCAYYYSGINRVFTLGNKDIHIETYKEVVEFIKWYNENK